MTDLQLGLLVIGAVVVAAVLVYNRLQERAVRREAKRSFASEHPDVITGDTATRREPTLEPLPRRRDVPPDRQADPRVDYIIEVNGVPRTLLEQRFGGKALVDDSQVALQLVSRRGVVGEAELLEFRSQVETLAAGHGGSVSAPEMRAALDAAGELDRACAELDIQIALHVIGPSAPALPEGAPFKTTRRPDGLTLLLDVPRTPELAPSYDAMVRAARGLGGRLVDDNGNTLDERALGAIRAEVQAVGGRLAALGMEPGSPLALRLFS
jgi:hypothetical protein